jgi:hypothetical protein
MRAAISQDAGANWTAIIIIFAAAALSIIVVPDSADLIPGTMVALEMF